MSLRLKVGQSLAVFLAVACLAHPAVAQSVSALKGHDNKHPIDISADRLEVKQKENLAVFKGAVEAKQGDLILSAEALTVYYEAGEGVANPSILRLDATGGVALDSPSENARGDWGIYDVVRRIVTIGGTVTLNQGGTEIRGDRLELDLDSGISKFDGIAGSNEGRVRGQFSVPEKSDRQNP